SAVCPREVGPVLGGRGGGAGGGAQLGAARRVGDQSLRLGARSAPASAPFIEKTTPQSPAVSRLLSVSRKSEALPAAMVSMSAGCMPPTSQAKTKTPAWRCSSQYPGP